MKKNEIYKVTGEAIGSELEGITHVDSRAVFVPGLLPEEGADIRILKVMPRYAYGKVERFLSHSTTLRRKSDCPVYARCGGCSGRHMQYNVTLRAKQANIISCFSRIAKLSIDVPAVLGMDHPFEYRNKTALPVGGTVDEPSVGFYAPGTHTLVHAPHCLNAMQPTQQIADALLKWMKENRIEPYRESTHTGLIRHMVVRVNRKHEAMVTLVINGEHLPHWEKLAESLRPLGVISFYISINQARTNVIFGKTFRKLHGTDTLTDTLCGLQFELSPPSFFQVNPTQTEVLYQTALHFAELRPTDEVVDLYCGAGTISLMLAQHCAHVTGIEVVPEAIENAKANAKRNGIDNAAFLAGKTEDLLPGLLAEGIHPRVIVADPPRKGMEASVIRTIAAAAPERVVYVSCDVATQARDAALFNELGYNLERVQPVDMFCWTSGVENVALFTREA